MFQNLTPDIQTEIGNNILLGLPLKFAAIAADVSESTFIEWLKQGERDTEGMFHEFFKYINECKAAVIKGRIFIIQKAAENGDKVASEWLLKNVKEVENYI